MNLRPATLADALQIAELHAASWRYAYRGAISEEYLSGDVITDRHNDWLRRLGESRPNQYVVVAESSGEILGFACAYAKENNEWGSLIDCIHVRQSLHGKGIGTLLICNVASWCAAMASDVPVYLWVLENNLRAQAFYQSLGANYSGQDMWTSPGGGAALCFRYSWEHPKHVCGNHG